MHFVLRKFNILEWLYRDPNYRLPWIKETCRLQGIAGYKHRTSASARHSRVKPAQQCLSMVNMLLHVCTKSPRRLVLPLLLLMTVSWLYGLYFLGSEPWLRLRVQGTGMRDTIIINQAPSQSQQSLETRAAQLALVPNSSGVATLTIPLDTEALRQNFPKLKEATKRHSGPHKDRINQMMLSYLPIISTSAWVLHSPTGRKFTVAEVQAVAKSTIQRGFLVPNIAHFVLPFSETNLQFHHMVSILSCLHVMKPHRLLLWYAPSKMPSGKWWERVRKNLTESDWEERIIFVQRPIPTSVYTVPVHGKEHQSDVMRLEAVLIFGGVYMDIDVLVLKPLEPLRKFPFTIGREVPFGLCNGIFMSAPNGTFLAMWHTAYQVFFDGSWGDHSVWLPNTMRPMFPDLCHVEEESMDRPNWTPQEVNWIYGIGQQSKWDWRRKNYAMHLWFRKYGKQHNMDSIETLDSMFGQMCRYILFGVV